MDEFDNKQIVEMKKKKIPFALVIGIIAIIVTAGVIIGVTIFVTGGSGKDKDYKEKMDLGRRYLEDLDYERAIIAFNEAIKIDPKNVDAYLELAKVYEQMGDLEMAIVTLEKAEEETGSSKAKNKKKRVEKELESESEKENEDEDRLNTDTSDKTDNDDPEAIEKPEETEDKDPEDLWWDEPEETSIISADENGYIEKFIDSAVCSRCGKKVYECHVETFQLYPELSRYYEKINEKLYELIVIYKQQIESYKNSDYYEDECEYHNSEYYDSSCDEYYVSNVNIINNRYLLITYSWYWYGGGAHGDSGSYQNIYDLETGEKAGIGDLYWGSEIGFKELLAEKTKEDYLRYISEEGYNRYSIYNSADEVYTAAYEMASFENSHIIIYEDRVQLLYLHYEMGSYADGIFEIDIPLDEFLGNPEWKKYRIGKIVNIRVGDTVNLYAEPSEMSEAIAKVKLGSEVLVLDMIKTEKLEKYYKVEYDSWNGGEGYIPARYISVEDNRSEEYQKDIEYYKKLLFGLDRSENETEIDFGDVYASIFTDTLEFNLCDMNKDGRKELLISGLNHGYNKTDCTIIVTPVGNKYNYYISWGLFQRLSDKGFYTSGGDYYSQVEAIGHLTETGDLIQDFGAYYYYSRDDDGEWVLDSANFDKIVNDEWISITEQDFDKAMLDFRFTDETCECYLNFHTARDENIQKYVR